ncbi:glycine cleavage system aminomethyltransferase GcvT [Streptomyces sp. NPDC046887]|uniref:glycine cleavage system aminomethyltransferase GcvT n=1 Tax=Streptomyces sp. NPDC046887 TaxID=3155472 RepID=UPI0033C2194D
MPKNTTPLHRAHTALGASFGDSVGWSMPMRYAGETAEHHAVRSAAGLFDLSHQGKIEVSGPEAGRALNHALAGDLASMPVGTSTRALLLHDTGGILDAPTVHRLPGDVFLLVSDSGRTPILLSCLRERADGHLAEVRDATEDWALLAVQGPMAAAAVSALTEAATLRPAPGTLRGLRLAGRDVLLARTTTTGGEDGFEVFCRPPDAPRLWQALRAAGSELGLRPCGLACRESLRLEAGTPLCGRELTSRTTPFDARLHHLVDLAKPGGFVGATALAAQRETGSSRVLTGLAFTGPWAPLTGVALRDPLTGARVGEITSAGLSPTLGHPLALAYAAPEQSEPGTKVLVDINGVPTRAEVALLPFYLRRR